jgi:hypothetical protein
MANELQRKSRKILLVLDKFAARHHLESPKNIEMGFLSANNTFLSGRVNARGNQSKFW